MAIGQGMGRIAVGLIVFALAGPAWAGVMSKAEFRLELRDAIVRLVPKAKVKMIDEDTLRVVPPGSKPEDGSSIFIGNAYGRYLNQPDTLETIVGQMARLALEDDKFDAVTQDNLIVLIRPIDYITQPGFDKIKFLTAPSPATSSRSSRSMGRRPSRWPPPTRSRRCSPTKGRPGRWPRRIRARRWGE